MRIIRTVLILILLCLGLPAVQVQAAPIPCDSLLYFAGMGTAMQDTTPPDLNPYQMLWSFTDTPYRVDYSWTQGIGGYVMRVVVWQNKRVVGYAVNGQWQTCHPSQAWKKYLLK